MNVALNASFDSGCEPHLGMGVWCCDNNNTALKGGQANWQWNRGKVFCVTQDF